MFQKPRTNCEPDVAAVLFLCHYMALYTPNWTSWFGCLWECNQALFASGQRPADVSSYLSFCFWHDTGSPGALRGEALKRCSGEIEGISDFFLFLAYISHCFATFLYSGVFLYMNILKMFSHSLFIEVIFLKTTAVFKGGIHGGHGSFLLLTQKLFLFFQNHSSFSWLNKKNIYIYTYIPAPHDV